MHRIQRSQRFLRWQPLRVRPHGINSRLISNSSRDRDSGSMSKKGVIDYLPAALLGLIILAPTAVLANMRYRSPRVQSIRLFDGDEYIPFIVIGIDEGSPNLTIYTLRPAIFAFPTEIASAAISYPSYSKRGIWSVECEDLSSGVMNTYIPLPPVPDAGGKVLSGDLRFLVMKDEMSETPGFLGSVDIGSRIEIRGAKIEHDIPEHVEEVLFVAQGGAIAAAFQAVDTMFEKRAAYRPRVRILWIPKIEGRLGTNPPKSGFQKLFGRKYLVDDSGLRIGGLFDLKKYGGLVSVQQVTHRESANSTLRQTLRAERVGNLGKAQCVGSNLLFVWGNEEFVGYFISPKLNLREWTLVDRKFQRLV